MSDARYCPEDIGARVNVVFGDRLATIRRQRGFTQTVLAERTGYSRATIANLEAGKQNVLLHQIFAIAQALGTVPSDLLPELQMVYSGHGSQAEVFVQMAKARLNMLMGVSG
jgi:transcriptional regulator with XRE-family HTH domain